MFNGCVNDKQRASYVVRLMASAASTEFQCGTIDHTMPITDNHQRLQAALKGFESQNKCRVSPPNVGFLLLGHRQLL
jgi:hypothetical protein